MTPTASVSEGSTVSEWRYRCPKGHTSWTTERRGNIYYCQSCDSEFTELVDVKEPADHHIADPEVTAV